MTERHKKQAVTESFSHTAHWPRSASKIKEEDYTLGEILGRILSPLLTLCHLNKVTSDNGTICSEGNISTTHAGAFGGHAVRRSFECAKSKIFDRMGRLAVLGGLTNRETTGKWQTCTVALWFLCAEGKRTHQWHRQQVFKPSRRACVGQLLPDRADQQKDNLSETKGNCLSCS